MIILIKINAGLVYKHIYSIFSNDDGEYTLMRICVRHACQHMYRHTCVCVWFQIHMIFWDNMEVFRFQVDNSSQYWYALIWNFEWVCYITTTNYYNFLLPLYTWIHYTFLKKILWTNIISSASQINKFTYLIQGIQDCPTTCLYTFWWSHIPWVIISQLMCKDKILVGLKEGDIT